MTDTKESPKPTEKFTIPTNEVFRDLDGNPLTEPSREMGGEPQEITLGAVLSAALNSDTKAEGFTLDVLDRLTLARRFKTGKPSEIRVGTCEQLKKLVKAHFAHSPILSGQALEMLGVAPNEDL